MRRWVLLIVAGGLLSAASSVQELEAKATALKLKGDAAGALAAYEQAAELDPKSARVQDEIGFLLAVLNRRMEAIARFERALALDAHYAPAQYHLGAAYFLDRDTARSIPHLQSAAALDPNNAEYRSKFGQALEAAGQHADAIPHLKAATAAQPRDKTAWSNLGSALQNTGDIGGSVEAYRHAVELDPADADARNSFGLMLVKARRADEAIVQFQKVLATSPTNQCRAIQYRIRVFTEGRTRSRHRDLPRPARARPGQPGRALQPGNCA